MGHQHQRVLAATSPGSLISPLRAVIYFSILHLKANGRQTGPPTIGAKLGKCLSSSSPSLRPFRNPTGKDPSSPFLQWDGTSVAIGSGIRLDAYATLMLGSKDHRKGRENGFGGGHQREAEEARFSGRPRRRLEGN
ncbi:cytochrome BD oxidase subunit II [Anopheles sinensis]|uniref:Cytochrome BD oxidase subunit II n=1 Tax=Anopheles sinensis TaxID=74873 RepID=A0A084VEK4_ANOSI|nr:cytochrome BD oxidase subunit II [Anopheles sinensis]